MYEDVKYRESMKLVDDLEAELWPTEDDVYNELEKRGFDVEKVKEARMIQSEIHQKEWEERLNNRTKDIRIGISYDIEEETKENFYNTLTELHSELTSSNLDVHEISEQFDDNAEKMLDSVYLRALKDLMYEIGLDEEVIISDHIAESLNYDDFKQNLFAKLNNNVKYKG